MRSKQRSYRFGQKGSFYPPKGCSDERIHKVVLAGQTQLVSLASNTGTITRFFRLEPLITRNSEFASAGRR